MTARIVSRAEAERVRSAAPDQSELLAALLRGEVIHFDDQRQHFNWTWLRKRHGMRLRSTDDGKGGRFWWVIPI